MTLRLAIVVCAGLCACSPADAQIRARSVERLPVGHEAAWSEPRFSSDGAHLFFTTRDYAGIWMLSLRDSVVRQLTADPGSGFGFTASARGDTIMYRRTTSGTAPGDRRQEMIVLSLADGKRAIRDAGPDVTLTSADGLSGSPPREGVPVLLGIEGTKIAILRGTSKSLLDPFPGGSYIWPSLSPDGSMLLAYEMDRGTFISRVDGTVVYLLGRKDAPVWTRDGRWVISMDDRDDGEKIVSSEILWTSPDGTKSGRLTAGTVAGAMYPHCSPTEDAIVFSTMGGELYLLRYEEAP